MARDGEIFVSEVTLTYVEDALIGTHRSPLVLGFGDTTRIDDLNAEERYDSRWYTVDGISLICQPTEAGVYLCRTFDKKTQTVTTRKVVIK